MGWAVLAALECLPSTWCPLPIERDALSPSERPELEQPPRKLHMQLDRPAHARLPLNREQRPHLIEEITGRPGEIRFALDSVQSQLTGVEQPLARLTPLARRPPPSELGGQSTVQRATYLVDGS
jgi:hypothetical protein